MMIQWRDISEAPKDGTRVLGWARDWQSPQAVYWDCDVTADEAPEFVPFWAFAEDLIADVISEAEPSHFAHLNLPA